MIVHLLLLHGFTQPEFFFDEKGIDSVEFISVKTLLQPNGLEYPAKRDPYHTTDPKLCATIPGKKQLVWSSEGQ